MPEEFKYIAVRNWAKYQGRLKSLGTQRPRIMMAAHIDSDPDYSKLTFFQRYVLDALRRLTALHGHNPYNDPTWVARATLAGRKDAPHVPHAIRTLTARGFLVLTNEGDPFSLSLRSVSEVKGSEVNRSEVPPSADESRPETEEVETIELGGNFEIEED
jgi:hypothetical protein